MLRRLFNPDSRYPDTSTDTGTTHRPPLNNATTRAGRSFGLLPVSQTTGRGGSILSTGIPSLRATWLAREKPAQLCAKIQSLNLPEQQRIRLAESVAKKDPAVLCRNIGNFSLPADVRASLAYELAEKAPQQLALNIEAFDVAEAHRALLAGTIAELDPVSLCWTIRDFDLHPDNRKVLADTVARKAASHFTDTVMHFDLPEQSRIRLAGEIAISAPKELVKNIAKFNIQDEDKLFELYLKACMQTLEHENKAPFQLFKQQTERFFSADTPLKTSDVLEIAEMLAQFLGSCRGVMSDLLKSIHALPDNGNPEMKEKLYKWWSYTAVQLNNLNLPEADVDKLRPALAEILKLTAPDNRPKLTTLLINQCARSGEAAIGDLAAFIQNNSNNGRTGLFALELLPIYEGHLNDKQAGKIFELLKHKRLLFGTQRLAIANSLLVLAQTDRIPSEAKRQLLQAALPPAGLSSKGAALKFAQNINILGAITGAMEHDPALAKDMLSKIQTVDTHEKLHAMLGDVCRKVFNIDDQKGTEDFAALIGNYVETSRRPEALLIYGARMRTLNEPDRGRALDAFGKFINATVLAKDSLQFSKERYSTGNSAHLAFIKDKAPDVFHKWQEAQHEVSPASHAGSSSGKARQPVAGFNIVDTDNAEDLFLLGTEVTGSCLSIHADPFQAKRLMANVLDGKCRLLAIKNERGEVVERRVARLLLDEKSQRPVMHLSVPYTTPGVPVSSKDALIDLAREKARYMGCDLVTSDRNLGDKPYASGIQSLDCPAPFEHLDELGNNQPTGNTFTLSNSMLLQEAQAEAGKPQSNTAG